jgi:hypothetical protein
MRAFLADQDVTLVVPLTLNGEPFIPDNGSVKWTLRDSAGAPVTGQVDVPVTMGAGSTQAVIVVLAARNAIASTRFTKRTVVLTASKNARPVYFNIPYRLTPWLNTTVDAGAVRNFIGVDIGELPDDSIDIPAAYFDVEDDITEVLLSAALQANDASERSANNAILAQAVINVLPGLSLRISQNESNGVFSVARPKIDLAELERRARELYSDSADLVGARLETSHTILLVVATVDPMTGV